MDVSPFGRHSEKRGCGLGGISLFPVNFDVVSEKGGKHVL